MNPRPVGPALEWAHRERFTVLATAFGTGEHALSTWSAWRGDPARCHRLFYVAIDPDPPDRDTLARALAGSRWADLAALLLARWPPRTAGLHALDFDAGRFRLLLAWGGVATLLPSLRLQADAFWIDDSPATDVGAVWQPRVLKALGRRASSGAVLAGRTGGDAQRMALAALTSAGFQPAPVAARGPGAPDGAAGGVPGAGTNTLQARYAPRFALRFAPRLAAGPVTGHRPGSTARHAVVVGGGLAGAAAARAFADVGLDVTVFDRGPAPATGTSSLPAGLFHGTAHPADGPYARLFRAAASEAARTYGPAIAEGLTAGSVAGLLRLDRRAGGVRAMRALIDLQRLPADYLQALDAEEASRCAGVTLSSPAWLYRQGGWIAPAGWVKAVFERPRITFVGDVEVDRLTRADGAWQLHDAQGRLVAQAPIVVLALAESASTLLAPMGHGPWPLHHSRGQVTHWRAAHPLRLPVAGDGQAVPVPGGLLCGATRQDGLPGDDTLRAADDLQNIERLQGMTGLAAPRDPADRSGWAGWRLHTSDNLPLAGAVPAARMPPGVTLDQTRKVPREDGLFVLTALGGRGLTLAPLLGRLVAAQAVGTPWPLEQPLSDAVDPARWIVRAARAGSKAGVGTAEKAEHSSSEAAGKAQAGACGKAGVRRL